MWNTVNNTSILFSVLSWYIIKRNFHLGENSSSDLGRNINFWYVSLRRKGLLEMTGMSLEKWKMSESL